MIIYRNTFEKGGETFCNADIHLSKTSIELVLALLGGRWLNVETGEDYTESISAQIKAEENKQRDIDLLARHREILEK